MKEISAPLTDSLNICRQIVSRFEKKKWGSVEHGLHVGDLPMTPLAWVGGFPIGVLIVINRVDMVDLPSPLP